MMMGDMGEFWRDVREHKREMAHAARVKNFDALPGQLEQLKVAGLRCLKLSFEHYRIDGRVDFWPSTGTWKFLKGKRRGHGFESLLKALQAKQ